MYRLTTTTPFHARRSFIVYSVFVLILFTSPAVWAVDGDLDTAFGSGGSVITAISTAIPDTGNPTADADQANALVIQPDGKLVVAGFTRNGTETDFALVRYNPNGSLDATFGSGGKVTTALGAGNDVANALLLQPDGKLVAVGSRHNGTNLDFAAVRYNQDGSLDATFGSGGKVYTPVGVGSDAAHAVIIQSTGKLVLGGYSATAAGNNDFTMLRYSANGELDTSFGNGGIAVAGGGGTSEVAIAMLQQTDGKLVQAGCSGGGCSGISGSSGNNFALARFSGEGVLDTAFGNAGIVITPIAASQSDVATALAQQANGVLLVAGYACASQQLGLCKDSNFVLARYTTAGVLDSSFATNGFVKTNIPAALAGSEGLHGDIARAVLLDGNKPVVAGYNSGFVMARYSATGVLDSSFGSGGIVKAPMASMGQALQKQVDGKLVIAGNTGSPVGTNDFLVARYVDAAGSADSDGDGIPNVSDNCPIVANASQLNTDGDSQGDACDSDDDNDGASDVSDAFPRNATEWLDTDHDGIGNNADGDDDNDGLPDAMDADPLLPLVLQVNGAYKGSSVREAVVVQ